MQKFLIIAMDMADLAAGIVFKRIVNAMCHYAKCDVICPSVDKSLLQIVNALPCPRYRRLNYRVEKPLFNKTGKNVTDSLWAWLSFLRLSSRIKEANYDAVIAFVYGGNDSPLILGKRIATKIGLNLIIYSVDAIPAPLSWSLNEALRNKRVVYLNKFISGARALFSANPIMLQYELNTFPDFVGDVGVILPPCDSARISITNCHEHEGTVFLYAGDLYGPRKITSLLSGFERFTLEHNKAKLLFVGHCGRSHFSGFEHLIQNGSVEIHGFTRDIVSFYDKSDVLIDINSIVEDDVFLSSKICNYLSFDKPIITISQDGSPVRALMSGIPSVIHCHHDPEEIKNAMQIASKQIKTFSDRANLKLLLQPEEVAKSFCRDLEKIL